MPENKTDQEAGKDVSSTMTLKELNELEEVLRDQGLEDLEEVLREHGMDSALAVVEKLKEQNRARWSVRRVTDRKMTPDLAQQIVILYENTDMPRHEIALKLGVNQGHVNEVINHVKWLSGDPGSPEAVARDQALERAADYTNTDEEEATLRHFAELCATFESTALLLHREVADDLRERRIALTQMSETQDTIQKKIDEANAWLARRAG